MSFALDEEADISSAAGSSVPVSAASVPFSSLNSNFSRPHHSALYPSRGKETATTDPLHPTLPSHQRTSRPPLNVLHDDFNPTPFKYSLSNVNNSHPSSYFYPYTDQSSSASISAASTSIRRTHSVYRDDESTELHTETPPKRLKLSFTLGGSPIMLHSSDKIPNPSLPSSDRPFPRDTNSLLSSSAMSSVDIHNNDASESATVYPHSYTNTVPRTPDVEEYPNIALQPQPPLAPYRSRGPNTVSALRSPLRPVSPFGRVDASYLYNAPTTQPSSEHHTHERQPFASRIPSYTAGEDQEMDDDRSTMSLDEHASLPSPRLSPVSATNSASASGSDHSVRDRVVSTLCLSTPNSWLSSSEWQQWNIGSLTPHFVQISGSMLEQSSNYTMMMDWFSKLTPEGQAFVFGQMFSKTPINVLRYAANTANIALKMDVLTALPVEISRIVVSHFNARTLCQAAQVSKRWRRIVDTDEHTWRKVLLKDGYIIPDGELERAVREGWGWQDPIEPDGYEVDLSDTSSSSTTSSSMANILSLAVQSDTSTSPRLSNTLRRKVFSRPGKQGCHRATDPESLDLASLIKKFGKSCPSYTYSRAAQIQVPNPCMGLPNLRLMHLFKSLYRRHYLIRESWLKPETKPYHLAFHVQHRHVITCLQFDSEKILTGSDNTNINVYDTQTGERLSSLPGHSGGVWALQYIGNTLVSGSTDRSVRIWDIEKARCLHMFQGHTSTVRCLLILQPTQVGENEDGTPRMMPSSPLIVTGSRDSTIRVWKLPGPDDRGIFHTSPPTNEHENPYFVRVLGGHEHSVRAIAAHGDTLVSGSYDFTVRVWEISTGTCVHRLGGHTNKVYSVVLDHERKRCISGSMDNLVKIWSIVTGECLFNLKGHTNLVGLLDLNQNLLVSAAADSTLRVWDPDTGRCLSTLSSHSGTITCFQHDGYKAISGGDKTLKMWDIRSGECVGDLLTNLSAVWQVRFDDRRCVAAVQRNSNTFIEVLDFGASRDGIPASRRGVRILVNKNGIPISDPGETEDALATPVA